MRSLSLSDNMQARQVEETWKSTRVELRSVETTQGLPGVQPTDPETFAQKSTSIDFNITVDTGRAEQYPHTLDAQIW